MLSLIAYPSRLSVAPGESIDIMVGAYGASRYRADLRRIIQGDINPEGPGYKDEPIDFDLGGDRPARHQPLTPGSYIRIPGRGILSDLASLTIATVIWPTRLAQRRQAIISLGPHLELSIGSDGVPVFEMAGAGSLSLSSPLVEKRWCVLVASYDATTGSATLAALSPETGRAWETRTGPFSSGWTGLGIDEAIIGAGATAQGGIENHFDGKIDSPALFAADLSPDEALRCLSDPDALPRNPHLLAAWAFGRDMDGVTIRDASPHHLDGVTVNCPARAMTGWRWHGQSLCWSERPDLYSAIHFHADDMGDAGWEPDLSFTIPEDLRSGIYAVRLVPDDDEAAAFYCIFAVRPPRDRITGNTVAFLMPTASYLAYANHRLGLDVPGTETGMGRLVEIDAHHDFLQRHPELGFSFYEVHDDGSGVFYSSRLRPIVDLQPKVKGFLGGVGSNLWAFNADTHITGWLDHIGQEFDVLTDEDLHEDGLALLRRYRVVITGTHPEYHSTPMLDALQGFVDRGGRLIYLGGNGFYWRISYSDKQPGIIECRRSEAGIRPWEPGQGQFFHAFTGEYGGLWRRNQRPPNLLCGVGMTAQGFDVSEPYHRLPASEDPRADFVLAGIAEGPIGAFGLSGGGAAGLEIDRADPAQGTPPHALVLATSTRHTDIYLMTPEDLLDPTPDWTGTQSELIRADMTFFETRGGGAVFSTGSVAWAGAMAWNGYANDVARITANVLRRFDDPAPFDCPADT